MVFLYVAQTLRVERLKKRELERYGDVIYKDPERSKKFTNFLDCAEDYNNNKGIANGTLSAHKIWLTKTNSPVLEITGYLAVEKRVEIVI